MFEIKHTPLHKVQ